VTTMDTGPLIAAWLLAAVVAVAVFASLRVRGGFTIVVRGEIVRFRGPFPPGYKSAVADFLREQTPPGARLRVHGRWESNGRLTLRLSGVPSQGQRQRIRNFLMTTLRP